MTQLAEITGLDRRTVKDRLANIDPHKEEGKAIIYDTRQALPILLGYDDPNQKGKVNKELKEQELRFERARAEKLEIELEVLKGLNVPIQDVCKEVEKEFNYVRSTLLSIPSRRAQALALENDPAVIRQILEEDVQEALEHLQADKNYSTEAIETTSQEEGEDTPVEK
jgi:phage terminase Nu1 subunit (DNA packaging protein)